MNGSTANIVALGMLEKRYRALIAFPEWFKVGSLAGMVACLVAWLGLITICRAIGFQHQTRPGSDKVTTPQIDAHSNTGDLERDNLTQTQSSG